MSVLQLASATRDRTPRARGALPTAIAALFLAVVVAAAVFGQHLAPQDPFAVDFRAINAPPSAAHWLGTDESGRDLLSRLIVGTRASLVGPALVVVVSAVLGAALALAAAWHGGWLDAIISRFFDVLFAFPGFILAVLAAALFGAGLIAPALALVLAYVPYIGRVMRGAALRERSLPYVAALQVQGVAPWRICLRHIGVNLIPLLVVQSAVAFGYALLDLAAISYVGLGLQPPDPEWGLMVADGQSSVLSGHPQESIFAGLLIMLTVVSMNLTGARLSARMADGR